MGISSHRARIVDRVLLERYSGCSEVHGICCTAVLSLLQLSHLGFGRGGSMSGAEDVEVAVRKPLCVRLAITLDIVRIYLLWAS